MRWPHRLARPRTPDSHSGDRGSNPLGAAKEKRKTMENVRPIFKKLLYAAIILFLLGLTYTLSDLHVKVGQLEHKMMHLTGEHSLPASK